MPLNGGRVLAAAAASAAARCWECKSTPPLLLIITGHARASTANPFGEEMLAVALGMGRWRQS